MYLEIRKEMKEIGRMHSLRVLKLFLSESSNKYNLLPFVGVCLFIKLCSNTQM